MSADLMELLASTAVLPSDPVDVDAVVARAEQHRLRTRVAGAMTAATLAVGVTVLGATLASSGPTVPDLVDVPERVVDRPVVVEPEDAGGEENADVDRDEPMVAPEATGPNANNGTRDDAAESESIPPPPEPIEDHEYIAFADDDGAYRFGFESGPMGWSENDASGTNAVWARDGFGRSSDYAFGAFRSRTPAGGTSSQGNSVFAAVSSPRLSIPTGATGAVLEFWYRWDEGRTDSEFEVRVTSQERRCVVDANPPYDERPGFHVGGGSGGIPGYCGTSNAKALGRSYGRWVRSVLSLDFGEVDVEDPGLHIRFSARHERTDAPCEGDSGAPECRRGFWFDDVTVRFITDDG